MLYVCVNNSIVPIKNRSTEYSPLNVLQNMYKQLLIFPPPLLKFNIFATVTDVRLTIEQTLYIGCEEQKKVIHL